MMPSAMSIWKPKWMVHGRSAIGHGCRWVVFLAGFRRIRSFVRIGLCLVVDKIKSKAFVFDTNFPIFGKRSGRRGNETQVSVSADSVWWCLFFAIPSCIWQWTFPDATRPCFPPGWQIVKLVEQVRYHETRTMSHYGMGNMNSEISIRIENAHSRHGPYCHDHLGYGGKPRIGELG